MLVIRKRTRMDDLRVAQDRSGAVSSEQYTPIWRALLTKHPSPSVQALTTEKMRVWSFWEVLQHVGGSKESLYTRFHLLDPASPPG